MYRHNVRHLKIFSFLIGFSLFAPLAIIYFSRVSGSYTLGASIFGITMLASAIFEVPTGVWSDRVGRRSTAIIGSWARLAAFVLYAISLSYWWLVAGAILEGLSRALYSGNNNALLYDSLADSGKEQEFGEYLGKTSAPEHLALGISALLGSLLASLGFGYALWLSVIAQAGLLYTSYLLIEPKSRSHNTTNIFSHTKEAAKLFFQNRKLRLLSLASMLHFAIGELKYQFRAAFLITVWPLWAVGMVNTATNFGASVSFYFSSKIIQKYGALYVLMFQAIYGKIASFLAYGIANIYSPVILMTPGFLHGVGSVAQSKLMHQEFSDHQRATMSSLNSLGGSMLFFIMSLVLGQLADIWNPRVAQIIMTFIELPGIYWYFLLFRNDKNT